MAAFEGDTLKEARAAKGWTQRDLAKRARVANGSIWNWENTGKAPRDKTLKRLARLLDREVAWADGKFRLEPKAASPMPTSRTKALRVNLVALNTARDTVLTVSKEREKQIYDSCNPPACTKEEGHARVEAWQEKVDVAVKAIDVGYRAIHDAALLDDVKSAGEAHAAFVRALDLVRELKELKELKDKALVERKGQEP